MKKIIVFLLLTTGLSYAQAQQLKFGINPLPVLRGMSTSLGYYEVATRFQFSLEKNYAENKSWFFALAYLGPAQKDISFHYDDPASYQLNGIRMDIALRKYSGGFFMSPGIVWEHTGQYEKGVSSGVRSDRLLLSGTIGKQITIGKTTFFEVYTGLEAGWDFLRSYDKDANEKYDSYSLPLIRPMCGVRLVFGGAK